MALALAAVVVGAPTARGQTPTREGAASSKIPEAQQRFHRGIELYKEGDLAAAQVEFKRAYELAPSYKILYNLGQVAYQRHDYATALRTLRQYLGESDDAIPAERQHQVARDIADLQQRVGQLDIDGGDEGAEVLIDDNLKGTTPLRAPIAVNSGLRKVDLVSRSGERRTRVIDVAGGEIMRVSFPRLTLRSDPAVPAVPAAHPNLAAPAAPASPRRTDLAKPSPVAAPAVPSIVFAPERAAAPPRRSGFPWKSWTFTGLLAGGAAATGAIAWSSKRDLDSQLSMFPANDVEIDYDRRRARGFALATDGLLIGTAIMTTLSLYLTFRDAR